MFQSSVLEWAEIITFVILKHNDVDFQKIKQVINASQWGAERLFFKDTLYINKIRDLNQN